jgi:hypothetical protein
MKYNGIDGKHCRKEQSPTWEADSRLVHKFSAFI